MKLPQNTTLGNLRMLEVLDFYDFPRLFVCANAAGQHFIAIWHDDVPGGTVWLYAAINVFQIPAFTSGALDIRDAFLRAADDQVMRVTTRASGAEVVRVPCEELDEDSLPPAGDRISPPAPLPNRRPARQRQNTPAHGAPTFKPALVIGGSR